ncbi:MAG: hypothetical protein IJ086_08495 [Clostridium sp.]|nr:hypothetical protein [Clostridium sp.]
MEDKFLKDIDEKTPGKATEKSSENPSKKASNKINWISSIIKISLILFLVWISFMVFVFWAAAAAQAGVTF